MSFQATHAEVEPAREALDAEPGLVLLEFGTPWCGHCTAAQPAIASLFAEGERRAPPDITHLKIEDGRGRPLGRSFRVKLWPTLVLLRQGEELARVVRPVTAADLEPLRAALSKA